MAKTGTKDKTKITMNDYFKGLIFYSKKCSWWGEPNEAGLNKSNYPVCPHCGVRLNYVEKDAWYEAVDEQAAKDGIAYKEFVEWGRGKCYPDQDIAEKEFNAEKAKKAKKQ